MNYETKLCFKVGFILFPFFAAAIRLIAVLPSVRTPMNTKLLSEVPLALNGSNVMILLGSGGHTGEMMRILGKVDVSKFSRTWVVSSNDTSSLEKAKAYEESMKSDYLSQYLSLHRARSVGEPLLSSVKNTLTSFCCTLKSLWTLSELPSVLLLNGPGTSVPLAYLLFLMKFFGLCNTRIIYIESLARVQELSLSGILLLPISDRFIVQWAQLYYKYKRAEYYGILI